MSDISLFLMIKVAGHPAQSKPPFSYIRLLYTKYLSYISLYYSNLHSDNQTLNPSKLQNSFVTIFGRLLHIKHGRPEDYPRHAFG